MSVTLYPVLNTIIKTNPELAAHRKSLIGGCCKAPVDRVIERRVQAFLIAMPQYRGILPGLPSGAWSR